MQAAIVEAHVAAVQPPRESFIVRNSKQDTARSTMHHHAADMYIRWLLLSLLVKNLFESETTS